MDTYSKKLRVQTSGILVTRSPVHSESIPVLQVVELALKVAVLLSHESC